MAEKTLIELDEAVPAAYVAQEVRGESAQVINRRTIQAALMYGPVVRGSVKVSVWPEYPPVPGTSPLLRLSFDTAGRPQLRQEELGVIPHGNRLDECTNFNYVTGLLTIVLTSDGPELPAGIVACVDYQYELRPQVAAARDNSGFRKELEHLLNCHSRENGSSTPDFILAGYLIGCLNAFDRAVRQRAEWYGRVAGGSRLEEAREPPTESIRPPMPGYDDSRDPE